MLTKYFLNRVEAEEVVEEQKRNLLELLAQKYSVRKYRFDDGLEKVYCLEAERCVGQFDLMAVVFPNDWEVGHNGSLSFHVKSDYSLMVALP
jgi:hypothetical protein